MASRSVEIHPDAIIEAQAARIWYEARSPAAGRGFLEELDRAVERISENPARWPESREGTRRFLLRRFPFLIVYREQTHAIQIIAVAHGRRRPGYWRERIG
jgi:plasmid stabilization system protein ParE